MVTDYWAVSDTIEPAAMRMPNLENQSSVFAGAIAWCTLNIPQGYWQVLLIEDAEMFTMVTPAELFTPRRVALGALTLPDIPRSRWVMSWRDRSTRYV